MLTFRNENIHSQGSNSNETLNRRDTHASTHPDTMRRRALWDIQVIIISLCFFVASLGHTALEPSLAVWIKSAFGEGSLSTGHILGIGGLTTILGSVISAIAVNAFQDRLWIICIASLCTAGVPLILLKFSLGIKLASVAISVFLFGVHATRFILISMCSTIASSRYPESYGLVFAIVNIGWGVSCPHRSSARLFSIWIILCHMYDRNTLHFKFISCGFPTKSGFHGRTQFYGLLDELYKQKPRVPTINST